MYSKVYSAITYGLSAQLVSIEVDIINSQLPGFSIVGLPDKSVQESKDRVISAIKNSGFDFPRKKIVINLAPADKLKVGAFYDLPIAISILKATNQVDTAVDLDKLIFLGELSLDGTLRATDGVLPISLHLKDLGDFDGIVLPYDSANEAAIVRTHNVYGFKHIKDLIEAINNNELNKHKHIYKETEEQQSYQYLFEHIVGQEEMKRACLIGVAGNHNMLFVGSPGAGKTMVAKCIPSILPDMTEEEMIEVTKVYSSAGLLENKSLIKKRPFRSPHHTSSVVSMIGGGRIPKPGELTLAHRGVLFFDELTEFPVSAIEALRQPLEDRCVTISRVNATFKFPANFIFVGAMNPCKCGWYGDAERQCTCSPVEIERHRKKISGPIMDRIDLQVWVRRVPTQTIASSQNNINTKYTSANMLDTVRRVRKMQLERYNKETFTTNSEIPSSKVDKYCKMDDDAKNILLSFMNKNNLSMRSYFKILKVALTINMIENRGEIINKESVLEAIKYRITI